MSIPLSRTSILASRHTALGSDLEDWNGMGTAWSYSSDPEREHDAVRDAAGLFDMSPLKKIYIRGADSTAVVDHMMTRDVKRLQAGQSTYSAVLTETGTVADDAIAANLGDNEWLYCHGSGSSMELLEASAKGKNVTVEFDDDLHNLALQGPLSYPILASCCSNDLSGLGYFNHTSAVLFGHTCRVSRTGYSGERGYEIFCSAESTADIWDGLLEKGNTQGILPCSFTALDKVRIASALLFYGYDMTDEHTPWEVGLGFTVATDSASFRGKEAAFASQGNERFIAAGIAADGNHPLAGGESLLVDGIDVGIVNSPCWSHRLGQSLALVHLKPEFAQAGTLLTVKSDTLSLPAYVTATPFFDPSKSRTRS